MSQLPDFFLASVDDYTFQGPFDCWVEATVVGAERRDYMLVRIDPLVYDPNTKEPMERILIAGRHEELRPDRLPADVYLLKITNDSVLSTHRCDKSNVDTVARGTLFFTREEAERFAQSIE